MSITAWVRLAEGANHYLARVDKVYVSGRFRTRDWRGNDGQTRTAMEVSASEMLMLSGDRESYGGASPGRAQPTSGAVESWEQAGSGQDRNRPAQGGRRQEQEIDIDDLPF
ncbi:MAG: single-stranded DNA-binding protein [Chloroflexi bacterium]|nr:single-stranded DNA-binding protein [Chloroflexota bacterium]